MRQCIECPIFRCASERKYVKTLAYIYWWLLHTYRDIELEITCSQKQRDFRSDHRSEYQFAKRTNNHVSTEKIQYSYTIFFFFLNKFRQNFSKFLLNATHVIFRESHVQSAFFPSPKVAHKDPYNNGKRYNAARSSQFAISSDKWGNTRDLRSVAARGVQLAQRAIKSVYVDYYGDPPATEQRHGR